MNLWLVKVLVKENVGVHVDVISNMHKKKIGNNIFRYRNRVLVCFQSANNTCLMCFQSASVVADFQWLGFLLVSPNQSTSKFSCWWASMIKGRQKKMKKGLNSLIILLTWEIWKHRNEYAFNGATPNIEEVLPAIAREGGLWCTAGATILHGVAS